MNIRLRMQFQAIQRFRSSPHYLFSNKIKQSSEFNDDSGFIAASTQQNQVFPLPFLCSLSRHQCFKLQGTFCPFSLFKNVSLFVILVYFGLSFIISTKHILYSLICERLSVCPNQLHPNSMHAVLELPCSDTLIFCLMLVLYNFTSSQVIVRKSIGISSGPF